LHQWHFRVGLSGDRIALGVPQLCIGGLAVVALFTVDFALFWYWLFLLVNEPLQIFFLHFLVAHSMNDLPRHKHAK
jgi:hypothetical protein